eukprot:17590-Pelagococcus_subviridis.AAC.12
MFGFAIPLRAFTTLNRPPLTVVRAVRRANVIDAIVHDADDVLVRRVVQPQREVRHVALEVVWYEEPDAVYDVRDPVLVQRRAVLRDEVPGDVEAFGDLRAVLLEVRELLATNLELGHRPRVRVRVSKRVEV